MEIYKRRLEDNLKRNSDRRTWWDGNSTRVWRCSMLTLMSLISFLGSWVFLTVVEFPSKFVIKNEYHVACIRIEDKLDKINEHLLKLYKERPGNAN